MKISVVTAVFNRESTIAETVESVRCQTHTDVEHIVQDGGSRDGTLAILQGLASPQMLVESTHDGGIYEGLNRGILRATGEVIGLMHSDDLFASENTLSLVSEAMLDPLVDGVYGDLVYVAANDSQRVIRYWRSGLYEPAKLKWGWMPPHPTLYLRRNVFDRLGLYDVDFRIAADYEGMLRFLVRGNLRLAYIREVMVRMRLGGESNRSIGRILQKSKEDYRAIRRYRVGGSGTLLCKNVQKLSQFILKDQTKK